MCQHQKGTTLFIVDCSTKGVTKGKNLDKIGLHACDTSELFFEEAIVPQSAILGELNKGFIILMKKLPRERLLAAIGAQGAMEGAIDLTIQYVNERTAFGKKIVDFQNTRFRLAEMATEARVSRAFVNECITLFENGKLDTETASMAKLYTSEAQGRIVDGCLQLFGGYGYMREYPIARAYVDARVQRIYGGTSEIMKEIISRKLLRSIKTINRLGGNHMDLKDKVAIVTGGASGLGLATVKEFVKKGAKVVIFDLNEKAAKEVCEELGENVSFIKVNVSDEQSTQAAINQVLEKHENIHICVNCAGIGSAHKTVGKTGPMPLEDFQKVIDVNLIGTFNVIRLAAEQMIKNEPVTEEGERGVIINTASIAAFEGQMGQAAYSASKGGIVGMTLPIARDLSAYGIRVNTIAPGVFETPLFAQLPEKAIDRLKGMVEFPKRLGNPKEYASLASFIVTNEYVNAQTIRLDGGITMMAK